MNEIENDDQPCPLCCGEVGYSKCPACGGIGQTDLTTYNKYLPEKAPKLVPVYKKNVPASQDGETKSELERLQAFERTSKESVEIMRRAHGQEVNQPQTRIAEVEKERDEAATKVSDLSAKVASEHRLYQMAFDNQTRWMDRNSALEKDLNLLDQKHDRLTTQHDAALARVKELEGLLIGSADALQGFLGEGQIEKEIADARAKIAAIRSAMTETGGGE